MSKNTKVCALVLVLSFVSGRSAEAFPHFTSFDGLRLSIPSTENGFLNPGVLVGFNPQPEPPLRISADLSEPVYPSWTWSSDEPAPADTHGYGFIVAFDFGSAVDIRYDTTLMARPDASNHYEFGFTASGITDQFIVGLDFSEGSGTFNPASFVSFNPQPEPPLFQGMDFQAFEFNMTPASPTEIAVTMSVRNEDLRAFGVFSPEVPEPSGCLLMCVGVLAIGGYHRARRRHSKPKD